MTKQYSVVLFGVHPDKTDDAFTGKDFDTLAEARECAANLSDHFDMVYYRDTKFVMIDGPDVNKVIPRKVPKGGREDNEGRMQAGMMGGTAAYNDWG